MALNCEGKDSNSLSKDSNKSSEVIDETPLRCSYSHTRRLMRKGASFPACRYLLRDIIKHEKKEKADAEAASNAAAAVAINMILQATSDESNAIIDSREDSHFEVELVDCIVEINDAEQDVTTAANISNYPILEVDTDLLTSNES
ncbi:uncharacterized protein LOC116417565 [Nasonia vitripennis]|uniref:Uncharacterized protein n=1 Tax=Nasonia vitripennis TaxID=7425 RepID=A0A7M7ITL6_NASVI|nr:uncharacterized protein LOC107981674 [Nasonia vitripennis]XP_031786947.1 uncharacterized protein LOC116417565 [Nasonia vitripennis]